MNFYRKVAEIKSSRRFFMILIICFIVQSFNSTVFAQSVNLSLDMRNVPLEQVLNVIETKTDYHFLYNQQLVNVKQKVTITSNKQDLLQILNELFKGTDLNYNINGKQIVLSKKEKRTPLGTRNRIYGVVTDKNGETIIGASIVEKGTNNATATDIDGKFELDLSDKSVLKISCVGYSPVEIKVGDNKKLAVTLAESSQVLNEVVVVGYGTQKKVNLTGSIETVTAKDLENRPSTTISSALQGKMAGVTIVQKTGQPGSDGGSIYVRGRGTLNSTSPLVIVDGVPGSMDAIPPSDIESITVLKDAASAAIYGSKAANGVILIVTKKGENRAMKVTYNTYIGTQTPTSLPKILGSPDYAVLLNEALVNEHKSPKYTAEQIQKFKDGSDPNHYPNTDWFDLLLSRNGFQQNHFLKMDGGTDKTTYYMSFDYLDQSGNIKNTNFDRYTFRANIESQVYKRLKLGANLSYRYSDKIEPAQPYYDSFGYFYSEAEKDPPTIVGRYDDGTSGYYRNGGLAAWIDAGAFSKDNVKDLNGIFTADLTLAKGLTLKGVAAIRHYTSVYNRFIKEIKYYNYDTKALIKISGPNKETDNSQNMSDVNLQALLNYEKSFGEHNIHALAGYSQEAYRLDYLGAERTNFVNNSIGEINGGSEKTMTNSGYATEYAMRSYFGRLNYDYKSKYLLEANLRADGSSRFAKGHRFGYFPSFSAGWRVSEESFMKELDWISNLKIRASYGTTGNNEVGNYPTRSSLESTSIVMNEGIVDAIYQKYAANTDIKWETTKTKDLGLDVSVLDNHLSASVDYFDRRTDDILMSLPLPGTFGLEPPKQNAGSIGVTGWEYLVSYQNKLGDFKYSISGNASFTKEKILDLKGTGPYISGNTIQQVGSPVRAFFGYECTGIFRTNEELTSHAKQDANTGLGDLIYKDQLTEDTNNDGIPDVGDGVINEKDRVIIGNDVPSVTYGFNLTADYKGWGVSAFFQGVNDVSAYMSSLNRATDESFKEQHLDRWSAENPDGSFPRNLYSWSQNKKPSSFWIRDASYLRLKNLQVSYTFPQSIVKKLKVDFLQLYFSGQNLLTFTSLLDGYDPENAGAGYYPQVKTLSLGLNVRF
ncbi:SusC/RagA family TonB-linked outer membrane protein [Bacteroides sedimenti]|uniref:SusC/RagA family TonB-linked outer membrane protein n=2 Tax=Bacteroides sedimenti TaxID=2136147 RepID=A0ABN6Z3U6_9BACE